ncbi:aminoacyl-tRNA hydrolase [Deinococcus lacus]|uniref:Peptidyl-tRNA hydrolase n=1 Tax=Deinococcus lacus TaxID=392561 RepID=A0ABW1YEE5_9DEIO
MRLIAGLGNPGLQYAQTRHNVGWLVIDELARRAGATWRLQEHAATCEIRLEGTGVPGQKVLLVKPQTFMNSSGKAVLPLLNFYKLPLEALLVLQDDLDSPFGLLKLRPSGRHGGQNGLRDIQRLAGSEAVPRLKLGISRPPPGRDPADWVLSRWQPAEQSTLAELVRLAADAATTWALYGMAEAQAQFNGTDLRPAAVAPPSPSDF